MADAKKMTKQEIKLADGRKLIYYTFTKQERQEDKKTCRS